MKAYTLILSAVCLFWLPGFEGGKALATGPDRDPNRAVRFEQRIGEVIPPDVPLVDEHGRAVVLGDFLGRKPVVLTMGYYNCPMLCGVVLNALVQTLQNFNPQSPARDFEFIFIGIDPSEHPDLAAAKKFTYLRRYGDDAAEQRWHFLTGSVPAIQRLAEAIGFHFRFDGATHQFVHPSGLVFAAPSGRISGYLLGVAFPPRDFARTLETARRSLNSSPVLDILLLCFTHSPAVGTAAYYVQLALRAGGLLTLAGLGLLIWRCSRKRAGEAVTP